MAMRWLSAVAVAVGVAAAPGGADAGDTHISQFIERMNLCFLEPGAPGTPASVDITLLGTFHIWKLCCKNTRLGGLDVQSDAASKVSPWSGETELTVRLGHLATECEAKWTLDGWTGAHEGSMSMSLETRPSAAERFVEVSIDLAGDPLKVGEDLYPWPGKVRSSTCTAGFVIKKLHFAGASSWIMNALGEAATLIQAPLRSMLCRDVTDRLPEALNGAMARARSFAEPLVQDVSEDLELPAAPEQSGPAYNLQTSGPLSFLNRLFQQGLETGDLGKLIQRATHGTGAASGEVKDAVQLFAADLQHPANLSVAAFFEGGGLEGVSTIDELDLSAADPSTLAFTLGQSNFSVSTYFRTVSKLLPDAASEDDDEQPFMLLAQQVLDTLLERFRLRLALSDVRVVARAGLLLDQNQVHTLGQGTSWYATECIPTMFQNASILGMDVKVTVDEFKWVSVVDSPQQLEADFERSVNNVLRYLNAPAMRPTISRLVRAAAAGPLRDMANTQIQALLAQPPQSQSPCTPETGFGSVPAFVAFVVFGVAACVAALLVSLRWLEFTPEPTRVAAAVGSVKRPGRWSAALLAFAGLCFFNGGLLGYPFRAAIRMSSGADFEAFSLSSLGQDTILYMYVTELGDMFRYIPHVMLVQGVSLLLVTCRVVAVIALAARGVSPALTRSIRWMTALGSWGMGVMYIVAGTQITSFYARILQFGDTFMDMGVQINLAFYVAGFGVYLTDFALLSIYGRCSAKTAQAPARPRKPSRIALCGLIACLAALLCAPWMTLWTHHYSGAVGDVVHYYEGVQVTRISIASILGACQERLLNPLQVGIGVYLIQLFIIVHIVIAPILHAALALVVGIGLRLQKPQPLGAQERATSTAAQTSAGGTSFLDPERTDEDPEASRVQPKTRFRRLGYALVLARMWSGADVFAVYMFLCVPDLAGEMTMLGNKACAPLAPTLQELDAGCMVMTSSFNLGLLVLLLAGLCARLLAEVCAHGPLRGFLQKPRHEVEVEPSATSPACPAAEQTCSQAEARQCEANV